jgi:hypothetical protein
MDVPSHSIIIEAVKNGQIYMHMLMYKIPPCLCNVGDDAMVAG